MSSEKTQRLDGTTEAAASKSAFTLVELLAVIVVIALLAALIVPLTAMAVRNMKVARVQTELKDLETIIKNYKETKGFYPPDNPYSFATNQLFYELNGAYYDVDAQKYWPLYDTNTPFWFPVAAYTNQFNVGGVVNSSQSFSENPVFTHNFTPKQTMDLVYSPTVTFKLLVCTVHNADGSLLTWNYNSSNPTNSPTSFDLWVDLTLRGKTNRFCNWSTTPIIL
jgi:prepilin-type N-terminal cleavage/methylation domain-containing protein